MFYQYDKNLNLTAINNGSSQLSYGYDNLNRVTSVTTKPNPTANSELPAANLPTELKR